MYVCGGKNGPKSPKYCGPSVKLVKCTEQFWFKSVSVWCVTSDAEGPRVRLLFPVSTVPKTCMFISNCHHQHLPGSSKIRCWHVQLVTAQSKAPEDKTNTVTSLIWINRCSHSTLYWGLFVLTSTSGFSLSHDWILSAMMVFSTCHVLTHVLICLGLNHVSLHI